jgi:hypothetical protein
LRTAATHSDAYVAEAMRWLPERADEETLRRGESLSDVAMMKGKPHIVLADDNAIYALM